MKRALGLVGAVLVLNIVFNWLMVRKNDGEKYLDAYLKEQKQMKVMVSKQIFDKKLGYTNYFKRMIFYKGIFGGSLNFVFIDSCSNKYFSIMRFDEYNEGSMIFVQSSTIENEELYVMVDSVQYNDPTYGTLEKPYVVFSYKGVNKKFMRSINNLENKGADGHYLKKEVPLAPSEEEIRVLMGII